MVTLLVVGKLLYDAWSGVPYLGTDLLLYQRQAAAWFGGGAPMYPVDQVTGPYTVEWPVILYPPPAIVLLGMSVWLPFAAWWLIPAAVILWVVRGLHPAPWAKLTMALSLVLPTSYNLIVCGHPAMWMAMIVALSLRWPLLSALILLKPSLFPFALIGIRHRAWWALAAIIVVAHVVLFPETLAWLAVLRNGTGPHAGLLYSLGDVPLMLVPVVAWVGRDGRSLGSLAARARMRLAPSTVARPHPEGGD